MCIFIFGCATPYRGGGPNFLDKDQPARDQERAKFELNDSFLSSGKYLRFKRGGTHTLDSMYPIVKDVSPEAAARIATAQNWYYARFILAAVSVSAFVGASVSGGPAPRWVWGTAVGAGVGSLACGIAGAYTTSAVAEQYNEALGRRSMPMTSGPPQFSLRFEY